MATDPLERALRELDPRVPPLSAGFTEAVLAKVATEPVPVRRAWPRRVLAWVGDRWRALLAAFTGAVLVAALTPPVRAAVEDWLGLGAVAVEVSPGPSLPSAPAPPAAAGVDLETARGLVSFDLPVPAVLGEPSGVEVSQDRAVVSMSWTGPDGPVRLDQVGSPLAPYFVKTVRSPVEFTSVRGQRALWIDGPHELVVQDPGGRQRTEPARLAGRTLIWESVGRTLRLEADISLARAVEIAESAAGNR